MLVVWLNTRQSVLERACNQDRCVQDVLTERQENTAKISLIEPGVRSRQDGTVDGVVVSNSFFQSFVEAFTLFPGKHKPCKQRRLAVETLRVLEDIAHQVVDLVAKTLVPRHLDPLSLQKLLLGNGTDHATIDEFLEEPLILARRAMRCAPVTDP